MQGAVQVPSGTVTLLFTDIQGSTRLWENEPEQMASALRRHDQILRSAIEQSSGFVFKTVGDAFCAAFSSSRSAVAAVLAAQQALTAESWPTTRPIRVRMGLHTGVCEERDGDYFGPVVNRTARLEAIAHGGQVLLSGATAALLSGRPADGVSLRELGLHRLKDLGQPELVFQLEADFLQQDFPPLGSLDNPELPNNLPSLLSAFIGRQRELDEVRSLAGSARLVTLTGAGGCGKTRLALQAAAEQLGGASDGAWFTELAPLTEAEQITRAVAAVLGLPDQGGHTSPELLIDALREQNALLVLDNCEHLIDAAAELCARVMHSCPLVRILATSREPLGIDGEHVYRVPSLSLPPPDAGTVADLAGSDAVGLFVDRARARDAGFALDGSVVPLVASVCRRLDGIPLALELAAARLPAMSLTHLSERLDQRFRLLTGGSRNAMPRQQTLLATVAWSFDLLTHSERETLSGLSVFAGGFELEAAEAVCATDGLDALDIADLLGSLVDKSLVVADWTAESVRYRQLETIRQYGAQQLLALCGEADVLRARDRHAGFYLRLAETAAPELLGRWQGDWLRRLDAERDNLRSALAHLAAEQRIDDVLRMGVALERFALSRGQVDARDQLRHALEQVDDTPTALRTAALLTAALLTGLVRVFDTGWVQDARGYAERALAMARSLGDSRDEARALGMLGQLAYVDHDPDTTRRLGTEAVALARQLGDLRLLGDVLDCLALVAETADERRRICLEAVDCYRQVGDDLFTARALQQLYGLDLEAGQLADARVRLEEAIAVAQELGDEVFLYAFRSSLGTLLLVEGRHAEAAAPIRQSLLAGRRTGLSFADAGLLFGAACCAGREADDYGRAARLHGAADHQITAAVSAGTWHWTPPECRVHDQEQARLRRLLGDDAFDDAYRAGAALSRPAAVDLALGREAAG